MTENADGQMMLFGPASSAGKMSPARSVPTRDEISKPSSRSLSASQTRTLPMCLCLIREDGLKPDASMTYWENSPLLGGFAMHSFGEHPREENASRLSWILEDSPHQKSFLREEDYQRYMSRYRLSAKACQGILNRAERRGKKLPNELRDALEKQAEAETVTRKPRAETDVLSFDPTTRFGGVTFENTATTLCNGTSPGYHGAIKYDICNSQD